MRSKLAATLLTIAIAGQISAQRNQQVDPIHHGNLVFLGPDASFACASVTNFTGSDPCHVGVLSASNTVTQATSGVEPHAVHTLSLTSFQSAGYRSAMTSYPYSPSSVGEQTIQAYVAAKAARLTYYDANHFNQKGGYDGGCGQGIAGCWDGWDYFNEFDCVGLTERAYELASAPDSDGVTPDSDPNNGCTWEGNFFMYPQDQYDSCKTTYAQAFPAIGGVVSDTVKYGFWKFYTIHIPTGVSVLAATTTGNTDVDLYLGLLGYLPSGSSFTCRSQGLSGDEQCQINNPAAGGWSFGVYGYANTTSSFTIQITQNGAPSALTQAATSITASTAVLNGTVTANGLSTTTAFDYGTTTAYGQTVAAQSVSGSSPTAVSANIAALACNTLYHYRVRGTSSAGTAYGSESTFRAGNCPVSFTNDPLVAGVTPIRAIHIMELRSAVNALRLSVGLSAFNFNGTVTAGGSVKASHIQELRTALGQTRTSLGLPQIGYTYPALAGQPPRTADIMEIRNALR